MSDALCGPSNAVQNLAKHSSVDRTLQQDRLISRHSPGQAFRTQAPVAASLDPEFDAFQAGPGPAFAPHSLAAPSFSHSPSHASFQPASTENSAEWTRSFQGLNISSPQSRQHQHPPQAWHNHFGQNVQPPTVPQSSFLSNNPTNAHMYNPLAFRGSQNGFHTQQYAFQHQQALQVQQDLHHDSFDESAFEAAFDAAMADASADQHLKSSQEPFKVDLYPHLPLFRVVLANAIVVNDDESLLRAAKVVDLLSAHRDVDLVQATLFRPLLTALNDPKRTLFAARFDMGDILEGLNESYSISLGENRLDLDRTTEQLLASYADIIWQRNDSNHLQPSSQPRSADSQYWLNQFLERETYEGVLTDQSIGLLTADFGGQLLSRSPQAQRLHRVLELEASAYSMKPIFTKHPITESALPQDAQAKLFLMMGGALNAPETVEALDQTRILHEANQTKTRQKEAELAELMSQSGPLRSEDLQDHQMQLMLLEQQNKKRLLMARMAQDEIERPLEQAHTPEQDEELAQTREQTHNPEQDDELAQTAAELLERVSDNRTSKFKNSAFLGLMRQLADREVRVEGDKMVPNTQTSESPMDIRNNSPSVATHNVQSALDPLKDGQEVVNLLNQPDSVTDQDSDFMMTSPFASATDY